VQDPASEFPALLVDLLSMKEGILLTGAKLREIVGESDNFKLPTKRASLKPNFAVNEEFLAFYHTSNSSIDVLQICYAML